MRPDVRRWWGRRTFRAADFPLADVRAAKGATTVSVVLPALDEEATVGAIVRAIRSELRGVVDELVVLDSGSADATAAVAAEAGATVVTREQALPEIDVRPGKGEVLWRSLAATSGDVVVFVDADVVDFRALFVTGLLGPLLTDPTVALVKAAYDRPLGAESAAGGRVTELVARPLLNLHWPQLAGFVQPLAGEYAARRGLLERLPFPCGYGVELGLLIDALAAVGLDALAQVDLGSRRHAHQSTEALGRMASEILQTALDRLESQDRMVRLDRPCPKLLQFARTPSGWAPSAHEVRRDERPPMAGVARHGSARAS